MLFKYNHHIKKKTNKFPKSFMISSCMSFKGPGKLAIITTIINVHVHIEILYNFLIPSIENWFGEEKVIFQDNYSSWQTVKEIKAMI